jgi:hypothetical protein
VILLLSPKTDEANPRSRAQRPGKWDRSALTPEARRRGWVTWSNISVRLGAALRRSACRGTLLALDATRESQPTIPERSFQNPEPLEFGGRPRVLGAWRSPV